VRGVLSSPVVRTQTLLGPRIDLDRAYRLHPKVSLRPEPFGALAYHYENRRLNMLRAPELVDLVKSLGDHVSARDALVASGIESCRWPSFEKALGALVGSDVLVLA